MYSARQRQHRRSVSSPCSSSSSSNGGGYDYDNDSLEFHHNNHQDEHEWDNDSSSFSKSNIRKGDEDEERDWRRSIMMSPSSYFLFGDDGNRNHGGSTTPSNAATSATSKNNQQTNKYFEMTMMFMDLIKDSIIYGSRLGSSTIVLEEERTKRYIPAKDDASVHSSRPTTTYLQLLDMYGDHSQGGSDEWQWRQHDNEHNEPLNDWLGYVDQTQSQNCTSTSGCLKLQIQSTNLPPQKLGLN